MARADDDSLRTVVLRGERRARAAQTKAVMPLIGPLLDAWEHSNNDVKSAICEEEPLLAEYLNRIATAMEG